MATNQEVLANTANLLNRIKTEGVTVGGVQQPINIDELNKGLDIVKLPQVTQDNTNYNAMVAGGNAMVAPDKQEDLFQKYIGSQKAPESQADLYQQQLAISGVPESQQRLNELQKQLAGIAAEQQVQQLQTGKEAISAGAIQGRNIAAEREYAIRAIPLQAQIAAEQGNLTLAQDRLNTVFQLKSKDIENQYNYQTKLIDSVYEFATKKEQQALDAKKLQEERAYNERKDRLTTINNLAQSYPDAGISPEDTFEQAQKKVTNSPSFKKEQQTAATGGLSAAAINSTVNSIASAFDNEPIVKNFNVIAEGKAFVDSLPTKTVNPADDQALIYALAKALDPNSVVREGEYATAQKYSQSWIKAYGSGVKQAVAGTGFLSETARKNIKDTINSRYQASLKNYNNVRNEYQRQIDDARAGIPRTITDYSKAYPTTISDTQASNILNNIAQEQPTEEPKVVGGLLGKVWNWLTTPK